MEGPREVIAAPVKGKSTKFFFWTKPGTPEPERKLVQKLDLCILTYCCLSFFAKDLDRNNVSNAYVSGMKEELGLNHNELNWFTTYYNIGYILGQIPSNLLLTKLSPRWYLPGAEFVWSFLVLFVYKAKNATDIYVLRFFIGLVEATCWPGLHFIIGTWFRNHEINKRAGIFTASGIAATMFSGYIQSGVYTSMNGNLGLAGWRWLFIIDFLITCPLIMFGLIFLPYALESGRKSWWMTEEERQMCVKRLKADKREPLGKFDRTLLKRVFGRWHFWIMVTMMSLYYFTYQQPTTSTMQLYLKAEKTYSVSKINNLPTVYSAISIVYMVVSGVINDWSGTRVPSMVLIGICNIIAEAILAAWNVPTGAKFFAFYIAGTIQSMIPIVVSWTHEVCSRDAEERAIVVASLNAIGTAMGTWWNQIFVKTTDAPRFYMGYRAGLAASLAMTLWIGVVWWFSRRQGRRERMEEEMLEGVGEGLESETKASDVVAQDLEKKGAMMSVRSREKSLQEDISHE
ncbi:MAG: hypothetical protein M1834_007055 [Cirrosporium novae-zelandiae]|nr:MAG: hypothetical protein M1834_007055 [Cirrosporium novae-zelandiae]